MSKFLNDLCTLMESPEFLYLRQQYMKEWSDVETMFMYIFMYEYITKEYQQRFHRNIKKEEMIHILQRIFSHRELRQQVVQLFRSYQNHANTILSSSPPPNDDNHNLIRRLPSYIFKKENENQDLL
uniref:Uncharacterized protein n=1 Tax=viral metagenome TaxID=1070528 RepID=A0A6C0CYX5_9ZZZZ